MPLILQKTKIAAFTSHIAGSVTFLHATVKVQQYCMSLFYRHLKIKSIGQIM